MTAKSLPRRVRTGVAVLGAGLAATLMSVPPLAPAAQASPAALLAQAGGVADLVERVMPAVVNITAESVRPGRRSGGPMLAVGQGSGFIIDAAGYVATNAHVVEGARRIAVTLQDGTRLDARLVGADPKTDIALLKVEPKRPLPFVTFADSDRVRVGEPVVAIGNPFGLGGTVTAGILSARARDIGAGPYDDFLQIDAAINRGNSGGPTFTLDGRVLGINTAIFSPTGGSVGIGFAIPANLARWVVDELRAHGQVTRSWIGVQVQTLSPDDAARIGRPDLKGALVAGLVENGPAARARLRAGDVILAAEGERVDDARDLTRRVSRMKPGGSVALTVLRDGREQAVTVALDRMPEDLATVPVR